MSSTNPKIILLSGAPTSREGTAAAALLPGVAVSLVVGVVAPAVAGSATRKFAREMDLVGRGIADPYATGERALVWDCQPGDRVYAFLGAGGNVAAGARLSVGAGGSLVAATPAGVETDTIEGEEAVTAVEFGSAVVAVALEAVNNSGGAGPVRIRVEVV